MPFPQSSCKGSVILIPKCVTVFDVTMKNVRFYIPFAIGDHCLQRNTIDFCVAPSILQSHGSV
jgi:hypothetical protein